MSSVADARRYKRVGISSVVLPFIGLRLADFQPFQYMLKDVSQGGVGVSIPRWLARRERLNKGDEVHLHVPFSMDGRILASGSVVREFWDQENEEQVVGLLLREGAPSQYGVFFEADSQEIAYDLGNAGGLEDLFSRVVKDSYLLKRGVLIYLRHLTSYFSRLGDFAPEEYEMFREVIIDDVRKRVEQDAEYLGALHEKCCELPKSGFEGLDLEELRQAMEPELYIDLFRAALGDETASLFLGAIKDLEGRLFSNYNTIVMLFIGTL